MIFKDNIGGGKRIKATETTLDVNNTTFTIPKGRHNGKGVVHIQPEEKKVKPYNVIQNIVPTDGMVLSKVIVEAIEGTAEKEDVKLGKTFSSSFGVDLSGTMLTHVDGTNYVLNADRTSVTIEEGYHDGRSSVSIEPMDIAVSLSTSDIDVGGQGNIYSNVHIPGVPGTASTADVLSSKTFSSQKAGIGKYGTMSNYGDTTLSSSSINFTTNGSGIEVVDINIPKNGFYNTNSKLRCIASSVHPGDATTDDVIEGKYFSSNEGRNLKGRISNHSGSTLILSGSSYSYVNGDYTYIKFPDKGVFDTKSLLRFPTKDLPPYSIGYNEGKGVGYSLGSSDLSSAIKPVSIGQSYTCPKKGYVAYRAYAVVTNHDNSGEMTAYIKTYKNGAVYKSTSTNIGSWSGGSMNLSDIMPVNAGDRISIQFDVANDTSIGWSTCYYGVFVNTVA